MDNVLVTGANGFLGKQLIHELIGRGCQVVALSRTFSQELIESDKVICLEVKNESIDGLKDVIPNLRYDCMFNFAWEGTSGQKRSDYVVQTNNIKTTCDYVSLCSQIDCMRFVNASSINEIETYEYFKQDEVSPSGGYIYGSAKLAAHLMSETFAKQKGIEYITALITNIYGAGEKSGRLIYSSINKLIAGEHCSFTEGKQTYDFIYLSDAINAIIAIGENGTPFSSYYIGSYSPKPLKEFMCDMRDVVCPGAPLGFGEIPFTGVSIDYDQFDINKVKRDVGYVNRVSFSEGIKKTTDWIRTQNDK